MKGEHRSRPRVSGWTELAILPIVEVPTVVQIRTMDI